jgi:hypothetical protein
VSRLNVRASKPKDLKDRRVQACRREASMAAPGTQAGAQSRSATFMGISSI